MSEAPAESTQTEGETEAGVTDSTLDDDLDGLELTEEPAEDFVDQDEPDDGADEPAADAAEASTEEEK